jgi:hypothetical protein
MREAIPPIPHMPSRRGYQLKHRDNFTFYIFTLQGVSGFRQDLNQGLSDVDLMPYSMTNGLCSENVT